MFIFILLPLRGGRNVRTVASYSSRHWKVNPRRISTASGSERGSHR